MITLNEEPFFYRLAEWTIQNVGGRWEVERVPETWHDLRGGKHTQFPAHWVALFCCPTCHSLKSIDQRAHTIDPFGKVTGPREEPLVCQCGFSRAMYLDKWSKKPLYACALEVDGKPMMRYCHARNAVEARSQLALRLRDKVLAVGPVIGYHIEEKDEKTLIA